MTSNSPGSPQGHARVSRKDSRSARRRQLLDAAAECFDEVGYSAVTVEMIASRAHTSRPTFYGYFKSKEDVFLATVRDVGESLIAAQSLKGLAGLPPGDLLAATTRAYIDAIFAKRGLVGLIDTVSSINGDVAEIWDEVMATTTGRLARFLTSIDPALIDPVVPPERLVRCLGDGVHYGAMRLTDASAEEKELFVADQILIANRLIGFHEPASESRIGTPSRA